MVQRTIDLAAYLEEYVQDESARTWLQSAPKKRPGVFVERAFMDMVEGNSRDALMLAQVLYWAGINPETEKPRMTYLRAGHLWIVKSAEEWVKEVGFKSVNVVRSAINALLKKKLIIKTVYRSPFHDNQPTCHVRPNWQILGSLLLAPETDETPNSETGNIPIQKQEISQFRNGETPNSETGNIPVDSTETTSETTSEITQTSPSSPPTPPDDDDANFFQQWEKHFGKAEQPLQEKLKPQLDRLGQERIIEVVRRCLEKGGRTWAYVLKALENEAAGTGERDYTGGEYADCIHTGAEGEETYEEQRAWARALDEARRKQISPMITATKNARVVQNVWDKAHEQLRKILPEFRRFFDGAVLADFEPDTGTFYIVVRQLHTSCADDQLIYNMAFHIVREIYGQKPYNLCPLDYAGWNRRAASVQRETENVPITVQM